MALNNKALKAGCEALRGDGRTIFPDVKGTKLIPHYPIKESKQQKEN